MTPSRSQERDSKNIVFQELSVPMFGDFRSPKEGSQKCVVVVLGTFSETGCYPFGSEPFLSILVDFFVFGIIFVVCWEVFRVTGGKPEEKNRCWKIHDLTGSF